MFTHFRQFVFVFIGTLMRWPLWLLIGIAGKFGIFRFVFLVYPTDEVECSHFCPNIPFLRNYFSGRPTPGGLIADGWRPIGIYFVIPDLPLDLARKKNRKIAENIVNRMRWIRRLAGAKTIGLAGQLGPIFSRRHNIPIEPPLFNSINGNIFSIHEAINWAALQKNTFSKQIRIGIIGGGELGETLHQYLAGQGLQSDIIDVRYTRRGKVLPVTASQSVEILQKSDFVINLLPKGQDFLECNLPHIMGAKTSVIDFSRPAIDQKSLKQKVYMGNRVQRAGIRFVLALPGGWRQKQLPACSLPALLAAMTGEINEKLDSFCLHARKHSFATALLADTPTQLTGPTGAGEAGGELIAEVLQ